MDPDAEIGAAACRPGVAAPRVGKKTLLIVYHSQTGGTRQMAQAAAVGAAEAASGADGLLEIRLLHATAAAADDLTHSDGFVFATPENLAAMSGLLKDFFDRTYYAALDRLTGRPYAAMICAGSDGTSAARQIERIATGWRLRAVAPPLIISTRAQTPEAILRPKSIPADDLDRCHELGGALAAGLLLGIF